MEKKQVQDFYANEMEKDRLEMEIFKLEGIRTKQIISRYLHKDKMNILDIGGGAGYYAFWLQQQAHEVTLVDLTARNIELVKEYSLTNGISLKSVEQGDATALNIKDEQFDLVLLLGPLYHLTNRADRVKAVSEAKRVLKPGGILLTAVISRYASVFDGFKRDLVYDDYFSDQLISDIKTGIHLNETGNPEYFTTAYFHTPAEIRDEIIEGGLILDKLIAIESFGWITNDFRNKQNDAKYMDKLLRMIELLEENEDLVAMSPHIMAVARKNK